jgi:acetylornithine deacetylase/succinyl-diaminopimelate desuccinylase-like protein
MAATDVVELLKQLVAIDSVNPSLVPDGAGETAMAHFIAGWAADAGLESEWLEAAEGRPSVIVRSRGGGGGRTLLLCGHIDTVGVEGMEDPFVARIDGDRLHGRGAYDMKAGVAAALVACREAAGLGLAGDVVVAAVADEEHASIGVREALASVSADAAIVTEPTEMELGVAHKGFVWLEIEVTGQAAHGSRPHLGVDAIVKSGPILTGIGRLDARLAERVHPLLGAGSVHASLIEGGLELSTYPDRCKVGLERRTLPGDTGASVEGEIAELLESCRADDPALVAESSMLLVREPLEIARDAPIVGIVSNAAAEVLGSPPPIIGASYWADSAFIAAHGIPTVLFGPGGEGAHALEEWVSIQDTIACTRVLSGVAAEFCA